VIESTLQLPLGNLDSGLQVQGKKSLVQK